MQHHSENRGCDTFNVHYEPRLYDMIPPAVCILRPSVDEVVGILRGDMRSTTFTMSLFTGF